MIIKIDVTQEDINEGIARSSHYCPVARAATRAFRIIPELVWLNNNNFHASVSYERIFLPEGSSIRIPEWVGEFISDFDLSKSMAPFNFEVEFDPQQE